ncbi:MAG: NYN domain-containing protein, partial [Acetobacteraceae bacterium]|nr:NYN domain-containing protein [Acetobacteraceae bacterium]
MDSATRRAALWLDFDNVFAGLAALDEWAAWRFASEPGRWLRWLAAGEEAEAAAPRRILVRRCYLNPAGWTEPAPGGALAQWLGQPRIYYSRFRAEFVRAGFQVVDCPRLARLKNGADILMALDIADALAHPTRFEEFVILSGDSDFTPLLHRLREHDRRSLLVAHGASAAALRAAADAVLTLEEFAEALEAGAEAAPDPPARPAPPRP